MRAQGYDWWIKRLRWATQTCDYIRLDHFRGFRAVLGNIRRTNPQPSRPFGGWRRDEFLNVLREQLGGLPFFAEDLGVITPDVTALRDGHNIPGMAVLQFGFGDPGAHIYLPRATFAVVRDLTEPRQDTYGRLGGIRI